MFPLAHRSRVRRLAALVIVFLAIEFVDEFIFGAREAAWPLIRSELKLNYTQIGLLLGIPLLVASLIESGLGILADIWRRKVIIVVGGVVFALSTVLVAASHDFGILAIAFVFLYPASGAFVSLSQSSLMDVDTQRHEHNMARWTFAGSLGVIFGTLGLGLVLGIGQSWRLLFGLTAAVAFILAIWLWRLKLVKPANIDKKPLTFHAGVKNAWNALKRRDVLRWLILLEFANLVEYVLHGYLALYLVDVAGVNAAEAGLILAIWIGAGLLADFLLIPLLERVQGMKILRITVILEVFVFIGFMVVPGLLPKVILLALSGFLTPGWYPILRGRLYSTMPGQSGTVLTLDNIVALPAAIIPLAIGFVAEHFGLGIAFWIFLISPIALFIGLPTKQSTSTPVIIPGEAVRKEFAES